MHVVTTHLDADHQGWATTHQVRGPIDLAAHLLAEHGCAHARGLCLIDPPTWAWNLAVPGTDSTASLGNAWWHLGQAIHRRADRIPQVDQRPVDAGTLVAAYGWDPADLTGCPG